MQASGSTHGNPTQSPPPPKKNKDATSQTKKINVLLKSIVCYSIPSPFTRSVYIIVDLFSFKINHILHSSVCPQSSYDWEHKMHAG